MNKILWFGCAKCSLAFFESEDAGFTKARTAGVGRKLGPDRVDGKARNYVLISCFVFRLHASIWRLRNSQPGIVPSE